MTTINTIEDLIRILDDNPEWLEALRARLLTRELLEMPNTLAQFMESTNQRFERVESDIRSIRDDVKVLQSDVKVLLQGSKGPPGRCKGPPR